NLSLIFPRFFDEATDAYDLMLPGLRIVVVGDQRHLSVVIDKTYPGQPLVGDALAELQHVQPTVVDAALRKRFVKRDHERLILRADGAQCDRCPVRKRPGLHILLW